MTALYTSSLGESGIIADDGSVARAAGLSKVYGTGEAAVVAFDNVTVEFGCGRLTAIMGPSSLASPRLMHCMAALDATLPGSCHSGRGNAKPWRW